MIKRISIWMAALCAAAYAGTLQAHHSLAFIDIDNHVWLQGTVVSYRAINPHALIDLEVRNGDGESKLWTIEGPRLVRLEKLGVEGDFVRTGDLIEVCGFFMKKDYYRDAFVHGMVLVRPDGQKWQWGPYGHLESCINPDEWDSIATGSNPLRPN